MPHQPVVPVRIDAVWNHGEGFPWTKFATLMRRKEIFDPQVELGASTADVNVESLKARGFAVCLFLQGSKTLGFAAFEGRGQIWGFIHVGFKPEIPGYLKKQSIIFAMQEMFLHTPLNQLSAIVPVPDKTTRRMAAEVGMSRYGVIKGNFLRTKQPLDCFLYGVTKDEFLVRELAKRSKRSDNAPIESQSTAN